MATITKSQWYGIVIAIIATFLLLLCLLTITIHIAARQWGFYFRKYLLYHRVHIYRQAPSTATWFQGLIIIVFVIGNVLCLSIAFGGRSTLSQQAGLLSTINLIPLAFGSHMNIIADTCGINLQTLSYMHRWTARIVVAEAVLHALLEISSSGVNLHSSTGIAGVAVSTSLLNIRRLMFVQAAAAMISISIASLLILQHHFYETFLKAHQVLAIIILIATWIHVSAKLLKESSIYLLATIGTWVICRFIRFAQTSFRSLRGGMHLCRANIRSLPDGLQIHVRVSRPWKYAAGQYLYLCMPGVNYSAWIQSHPYFLSWWYKDEGGRDVAVFIIECRSGFSKSLRGHSSGSIVLGAEERWPRGEQVSELRTFVEGPYGCGTPLGEYGTVLLFATGIGIAGLLPYLKEFLHGFYDWDVKARRIELYWEVQSERGS